MDDLGTCSIWVQVYKFRHALMLCSILENYIFTCILILVYHKEPILAIIYEGVSAYYCSEFCSILVIVLSMFVQPFHMFLFVLPLYKLCFFFLNLTM